MDQIVQRERRNHNTVNRKRENQKRENAEL